MNLQRSTSVISKIDALTDWLGRGVAWLTLIIVVLTFLIVLLRYGFNLGWIAMQESVLYLHGLIFMAGAAYTLKHDAHVRVDIFYQHFSPRQQAWVNLLGGIFLLYPTCLFIAYVSWDYVLRAWQIMEVSPEAGGLPLVYLSKSYIFVFVITLCLQAFAESLRAIQQIQRGEQ